MKNFKFTWVLMLVFGLVFVACNKSNEFAEEVQLTEEASPLVDQIETADAAVAEGDEAQMMIRRHPCWPSPYEVLPNVNSQYHCEVYYGCIWYNNVCYWCW